jgi:uroporphyrinogen-III decarboxylase
MPEKILAVIDVMMEEQVAGLRQLIRATHAFSIGGFGAARGAGGFLSPKAFEKFLWPYMKKLVEVTVEEGAIAYLHLDLSWDRLIDYFLELPKGKCIFSPDSTTDIFKAAKVLKGHMAFAGDLAASLLTLGTPEQVHAYCQRLIDEVGPQGLIMAAGCAVPSNAKKENVEAMIQAATRAPARAKQESIAGRRA